ncbi:MFS transporter [Timonella senegalensis]|uniref:MFS transporter n=1 Tax=Timonella senegalensis TaxID=1465825 RepID=UPI0012B60D39|nr:MFS transporter [Timonella senegalensis]
MATLTHPTAHPSAASAAIPCGDPADCPAPQGSVPIMTVASVGSGLPAVVASPEVPEETLVPASSALSVDPVVPVPGYRPGTREFRNLMTALFCAGLATFAQLYAPQAVLPEIGAHLGLSQGSAGLVVSMGTIGLAVGVIPWAAVSERLGRVRTMCIALITATALTLVTPLAANYGWLLGLRCAAGFSVGAVPALAVAYLNAEVARSSAAKAAGMFIAGNSIGGLAGRLIAGMIAPSFGWHLAILAVSVMAAIATVGFVALIPPARRSAMECSVSPARSLPRDSATPTRPGQNAAGGALVGESIVENQGTQPRRRPYRTNLGSAAQRRIFAQGFLIMGGFVATYNYMGFRLQGEPFGLRPEVTSLIFMAYICGTFASVRAAELVGRLGRARVVAVTSGSMLAGIALTLVSQLWAQIAGLLLVTVGFFGGQAVASGWASAGVPEARTQAGALYTLSYYAGGSLMGWLGGELFAVWGWAGTVAMIGCAAAASVVLAIVMGTESE